MADRRDSLNSARNESQEIAPFTTLTENDRSLTERTETDESQDSDSSSSNEYEDYDRVAICSFLQELNIDSDEDIDNSSLPSVNLRAAFSQSGESTFSDEDSFHLSDYDACGDELPLSTGRFTAFTTNQPFRSSSAPPASGRWCSPRSRVSSQTSRGGSSTGSIGMKHDRDEEDDYMDDSEEDDSEGEMDLPRMFASLATRATSRPTSDPSVDVEARLLSVSQELVAEVAASPPRHFHVTSSSLSTITLGSLRTAFTPRTPSDSQEVSSEVQVINIQIPADEEDFTLGSLRSAPSRFQSNSPNLFGGHVVYNPVSADEEEDYTFIDLQVLEMEMASTLPLPLDITTDDDNSAAAVAVEVEEEAKITSDDLVPAVCSGREVMVPSILMQDNLSPYPPRPRQGRSPCLHRRRSHNDMGHLQHGGFIMTCALCDKPIRICLSCGNWLLPKNFNRHYNEEEPVLRGCVHPGRQPTNEVNTYGLNKYKYPENKPKKPKNS